ncbi:DMT family transporter [Novosphingobium sp.]|uniref:DMT family transporter n=1 Tax=Novosphingobium sp. TaxID=1874826 RepID=UPI0025D9FD62|nr:DMT family transporter [Novosphingobium sp.]
MGDNSTSGARSTAAPAVSVLIPILVVIFGLGLFGAMDGVMKGAALAVGAYTAMLWRTLTGATLMLPVWRWRAQVAGRGMPDAAALRLHATRGGVGAIMATMFFYGLARTPMAEAMALSFIAPLIALFLAAALLGETLSKGAVGGSVVALIGVSVIAQGKLAGPHDAESIKGMAAVLVSAVFYAWNLVLQRQQAQIAQPEEIAFFQAGFSFMFLALASPWLATWPGPHAWVLIVSAALLAAASVMLLSWAYARAEAQVLVPMEYTAFIWAALFGWLAFDESLTWSTLGGVVLIVGGCLYAARRGNPADFEAPPPG